MDADLKDFVEVALTIHTKKTQIVGVEFRVHGIVLARTVSPDGTATLKYYTSEDVAAQMECRVFTENYLPPKEDE